MQEGDSLQVNSHIHECVWIYSSESVKKERKRERERERKREREKERDLRSMTALTKTSTFSGLPTLGYTNCPHKVRHMMCASECVRVCECVC